MKIAQVREKVSHLNVLYVEDEAAIREDGALFFQKFFASVLPVENGEDAISQLEKRSFDLVITDLKMPKIGGDALFDYIKERFSSLPVIVISGLSSGDGVLLTKYPYRLEKPWNIDSFVDLLDSMF